MKTWQTAAMAAIAAAGVFVSTLNATDVHPTAPPDPCELVRPELFQRLQIPATEPKRTQEAGDAAQYRACEWEGPGPRLFLNLSRFGRHDGKSGACTNRSGAIVKPLNVRWYRFDLGDEAVYFTEAINEHGISVYVTACLGTYGVYVHLIYPESMGEPATIKAAQTLAQEVFSQL